MPVGLGPGHTVLDGDPPLPPAKGHSPPTIFGPYLLRQMAAWIRMPLGIELDLGPGDFVLDGDRAPPPQKGSGVPKFSAHVYCVKTAGWIKMELGVEVGLSSFFVHYKYQASST